MILPMSEKIYTCLNCLTSSYVFATLVLRDNTTIKVEICSTCAERMHFVGTV